MFERACEEGRGYTRPAILLFRVEGGDIGTGVGTFIVVNAEGWILTAAHILEPMLKSKRDAAARLEYARLRQEIEADSTLSPGKKKRRINELVYDRTWISHINLILAPGRDIEANATVDPITDLALVKLPDISTLAVTHFPVFGNPRKPTTPGASLCRMGFAFHKIEGVTFDTSTGRFAMPPMPPLAIFPNEGIHTRNQIVVHTPSGRRILNLETSSPGLKGQSGGPIFDRSGHIWAIQSKTLSLPLGISCKVKDGGREITEHQFMHVGVGPHVSHIREFMDTHNVRYQAAENLPAQ